MFTADTRSIVASQVCAARDSETSRTSPALAAESLQKESPDPRRHFIPAAPSPPPRRRCATPAKSWLIILTVEPCPDRSPIRCSFAAIAEKTLSQSWNARSGPDAMIDSCPSAALMAPPETGASICSSPFCCRRRPSSAANPGENRAVETTTDPGAIAATAPFAPKSASSVCSALTTRMITTFRSRAEFGWTGGGMATLLRKAGELIRPDIIGRDWKPGSKQGRSHTPAHGTQSDNSNRRQRHDPFST